MPTDGEIDFARLGAAFCLSGGHIKNAVFKAAFRAASSDGPLTQAQLEEAALEEGDSVEGMAGKRRAMGFVA